MLIKCVARANTNKKKRKKGGGDEREREREKEARRGGLNPSWQEREPPAYGLFCRPMITVFENHTPYLSFIMYNFVERFKSIVFHRLLAKD